VRDIGDFASSEWANWWGAIEEVDDRAGGTARIPGKPWRFSNERLDHPGTPAFRGEHNAQILGELGLTPESIRDLTARGVVTADPVSA